MKKTAVCFSFALLVATAWYCYQGDNLSYTYMTIRLAADTKTTEQTGRTLSLPPAIEISPSDKEKEVLLNDPNMNRSWGLSNTQGTNIRATKAWTISQGSRDVVLAIIDTGVDVNHPDIKNNLWVNPGEDGKDALGRSKRTNGLDDDGNGYVDDVHGWNFVANNSSLVDNHGHGTHVSGIAGAEGGNGIGISGVAPKVSLMILKYYDPTSSGNDNLRNTIRAIRYAVQKGANIINYSGGGLDPSPDELEAVRMAQKRGILFVAAAGNEKSNSDIHHYYPANYPLDNIISVTAVNPSGQVLSSSNFGENSVHIAAPGENIYSTLPGNRYGLMTGTSQATAFVSGVAALILSSNKTFNYLQVKRQILNTANQSPTLMGKSKTWGILNSWAALAIQPQSSATGLMIANTHQTFSAEEAPAPHTPRLSEQLRAIGGLLNKMKN